MKHFILALGACFSLLLFSSSIAYATSTFITQQGGTGTTSPSGILYGDAGSTNHLNTVTIGTNLTFSAGTLSASGGGGTGSVSTSSQETGGQIAAWGTTNGFPAKLYSVATSTVSAGTGLTTTGTAGFIVGGSSYTFKIADTAVTPGAYTNANITVDQQGRITLAANGAAAGQGALATSSAETAGQVPYWTTTSGSPAKLGSIATSTLGFSGPFIGYSTLGTLIGGSNSTLTWTGLATTSQPSSSNLLVSNGLAGVYGAATSSVGVNGPITFSGTLGAQVGGTGGSFGCATCLTANQTITLTGVVTGSGSTAITTAYPNAAINTVLANATNASAAPTFVATSTFFGSGTGGQTLTWNNGSPQWVSTTTFNSPLTFASGAVSCSTCNTTNATVSSVAASVPAFLSISGSPITTSGTLAITLSGTALPIANGGTGTTTAPVSQLLYGGSGSVYQSVATTTFALPEFTITGTLGAFVGGANSSASLTTNGVALTKLAQIAANSVLGNKTGATANVVAFATSTIFNWSAGLSANTNQVSQIEHPSFSYATTSWVGTTTIPIQIGYGEAFNNVRCFTDVGTVNVDFYHATTHFITSSFNASTTIGTITFTSTTDTDGDKTYVDLGTPASSPTRITCTVQKTY